MRDRSVFKSLFYRLLEDPKLAAAVMGEGEDARRDALADFLQESGVPEERWPGVVESLNEILAQVDRGEIAKLQVALDGIQPRAPL